MVKLGDIVISKAGHDEGRAYVVVATLGSDFVAVSDGSYRKLANPKTKRVKHLRCLLSAELDSEAMDADVLTDADIVYKLKKALKTKSQKS